MTPGGSRTRPRAQTESEMADAAQSFMEAERDLSQVATDLAAFRRRAFELVQTLQSLIDSFDATVSAFSATLNYIDTQAAANPASDDWQRLKRKRDIYTASAQAARARLISMRNALSNASTA